MHVCRLNWNCARAALDLPFTHRNRTWTCIHGFVPPVSHLVHCAYKRMVQILSTTERRAIIDRWFKNILCFIGGHVGFHHASEPTAANLVLVAVLSSKTLSLQTAMPSLRVPVLAPMTVAVTSGTSCTEPFMLPTNNFPTLSLSLTNWSLPMEQESTSPVIWTAAVNCGCLLQCS